MSLGRCDHCDQPATMRARLWWTRPGLLGAVLALLQRGDVRRACEQHYEAMYAELRAKVKPGIEVGDG